MTRASTVVAVPACNEADRITACLHALRDQRGLDGEPLALNAVRVIVFANNCTDATASIARGCGAGIEVVETTLPPGGANAGAARRAAMDAAADRVEPGGLICTTDADSRPRADWIARLWKAVDAGAEAVAGTVDFDPQETTSIAFSEARRRESHYSALQAEIIARADPQAHNPWPNHIWAWGANLAVTAAAYQRVGGLPRRALAEDRAFVERLHRHDVRVRHCLDARVWTSPRSEGRADGGLASLVCDHLQGDSAPCDVELEPALTSWRRAAARGRFRRAYAAGGGRDCPALRLKVAASVVRAALEQETFGEAWSLVEAASTRLSKRRLTLLDLPGEITRAERLLRRIGPREPGDQRDRARAASAGLWSDAPPWP